MAPLLIVTSRVRILFFSSRSMAFATWELSSFMELLGQTASELYSTVLCWYRSNGCQFALCCTSSGQRLYISQAVLQSRKCCWGISEMDQYSDSDLEDINVRIKETYFEQSSTRNLARYHHFQIVKITPKTSACMYKYLMNHTVITYRDWNEIWQKEKEKKYDCYSAIMDEELTQRNCRDNASFPLVD